MAIARWEPVRELNTLQQEINRLFGGFFDQPASQAGATSRRQWIPAMDLVEADGAYVLRADLPGLGGDDVKIELEDNVLTVSGERNIHSEQREEGYYRLERASGSFSRSLTLPQGVNADAIEASFTDGVLEIRIPVPEQRKPRRVTIATTGQGATVEGTEATTPEHVEATAEPVGAAA
jgi:HSP20 family protein